VDGVGVGDAHDPRGAGEQGADDGQVRDAEDDVGRMELHAADAPLAGEDADLVEVDDRAGRGRGRAEAVGHLLGQVRQLRQRLAPRDAAVGLHPDAVAVDVRLGQQQVDAEVDLGVLLLGLGGVAGLADGLLH
jgi:hypothetical protein